MQIRPESGCIFPWKNVNFPFESGTCFFFPFCDSFSIPRHFENSKSKIYYQKNEQISRPREHTCSVNNAPKPTDDFPIRFNHIYNRSAFSVGYAVTVSQSIYVCARVRHIVRYPHGIQHKLTSSSWSSTCEQTARLLYRLLGWLTQRT